MKNSLLSLAILSLAFLFTNSANASTNKQKADSLYCLQINGKISNAGDTEEACFVELIELNGQIDTVILKGGKSKFNFVLNINRHYTIRISKTGYSNKSVAINTEIITGTDELHVFEFELDLIKEKMAKNLNKDVIDYPVAIIQFDYEADDFTHNQEYADMVKKELYKVEPSYKRNSRNEIILPLTLTSYAYTSR